MNGLPYTSSEFNCPPGKASPPNGIAFWSYRCMNGTSTITFDAEG